MNLNQLYYYEKRDFQTDLSLQGKFVGSLLNYRNCSSMEIRRHYLTDLYFYLGLNSITYICDFFIWSFFITAEFDDLMIYQVVYAWRYRHYTNVQPILLRLPRYWVYRYTTFRYDTWNVDVSVRCGVVIYLFYLFLRVT